ncbi:MAG: CinA family nicotinamide mononucleotide deamidase-related protein [Chloroflexi bacterium]|nr:CinA family nicotinamide mononucleotide deamidase-related protein [Chloroflexota bacterium]
MQAEIISIGTELLLGEIIDTNAAWIARQLTTIGLNLYFKATVGDNQQRIAEILRNGLKRSDVIITTGGLGPTVDDVTREAVAAATDRDLVLDEALLAEVGAFFLKMGRTMTANNRKQACLPRDARVIHNPVGTAPAFAVEVQRPNALPGVIISLPGVPHEMQYLMEHEVLPWLRARYGLTGVIKSRIVHTCGIGESAIDAQIGDLMHLSNPTVGTAAHPGQTDVRIAAKAESAAEAETLIAPVERTLRERLGEYIYGVDGDTLAGVLCALLAERGWTLALADGVSSGEISLALSQGAAGRPVLAGALVATGTAGVREALGLAGGGAADAQTASDAARAVSALYRADLGLAVVGPQDPAAAQGELIQIALAHRGGVALAEPRVPRADPSGRGWLLYGALDVVRRHLLGLHIM